MATCNCKICYHANRMYNYYPSTRRRFVATFCPNNGFVKRKPKRVPKVDLFTPEESLRAVGDLLTSLFDERTSKLFVEQLGNVKFEYKAQDAKKRHRDIDLHPEPKRKIRFD